jgi:hypothetical protein
MRHQVAVPTQDGIGAHQQPYPPQHVAGSRCSTAARKARSEGSSRILSPASCRCSTVIWWRRTRISAFLAWSLIGSSRSRASAFVMPRYASRSSTTSHRDAVTYSDSTSPDMSVGTRSAVPSGQRPPGRMGLSAPAGSALSPGKPAGSCSRPTQQCPLADSTACVMTVASGDAIRGSPYLKHLGRHARVPLVGVRPRAWCTTRPLWV